MQNSLLEEVDRARISLALDSAIRASGKSAQSIQAKPLGLTEVLKQSNSFMRALFSFAFFYGLRPGEIAQLTKAAASIRFKKFFIDNAERTLKIVHLDLSVMKTKSEHRSALVLSVKCVCATLPPQFSNLCPCVQINNLPLSPYAHKDLRDEVTLTSSSSRLHGYRIANGIISLENGSPTAIILHTLRWSEQELWTQYARHRHLFSDIIIPPWWV
jgi:hypothetical protein